MIRILKCEIGLNAIDYGGLTAVDPILNIIVPGMLRVMAVNTTGERPTLNKERLFAWIMVDDDLTIRDSKQPIPEKNNDKIQFLVVSTGEDISQYMNSVHPWRFINTVIMLDGTRVFHVFYRINPD